METLHHSIIPGDAKLLMQNLNDFNNYAHQYSFRTLQMVS